MVHGDGTGPATYQGRRVVIVDDERFIRTILGRMLGELGLQVVGNAADGGEALALCAELRPDLVTLDIAMPGMDGLETLRRLLAAQPDCRVLMSTSFHDRRFVAEAVKNGARGYLTKPFDLASIREKLAQIFPGVAPSLR